MGRDEALGQLRRALRLAVDGHGQVVAAVGEAGMGKSRLFFEFARHHREHGWLCLDAPSGSYGKATSYLPVIGVLKDYFKVQEKAVSAN